MLPRGARHECRYVRLCLLQSWLEKKSGLVVKMLCSRSDLGSVFASTTDSQCVIFGKSLNLPEAQFPSDN